MSQLISIFLPDGNPGGVKVIELNNRIIRAVLVPRAKLNDVKTRKELNQPALYMLCDREGQNVYIGECENFVHRIKSHDQGKDFWETAIAFVAKDNGLEKGDVKFLESLSIESAKNSGRMNVINNIVPTRNNLHEFKVDSIKQFFDDVRLLSSTLGYPAFDNATLENTSDDQTWYCNVRATRATAIYDGNGFTVLRGSIIDGTERPSFAKLFPFAAQERRSLLASKSRPLDDSKKLHELIENLTFSSSNKAAGFCVGGHVNAWTTWKNKAGSTMDKILRH